MTDAMERAERRRRRRRRMFGLLLVAVLVASFFLIRCGGGFGIGGGGGRGVGRGTAQGLKSGSGPAAVVTDAGVRCRVRVDATGVTVDGRAAPVAEVVTACRTAGAAEVIVTGDARQGQWDELRAALEAAAVPAFVNGAGSPTPTLDAGS